MTPPTQFISFNSGDTVVSDAWVCVAGLSGSSSNGTYTSTGYHNARRYYEKSVDGSPYYIYWVNFDGGSTWGWAWHSILGAESPVDSISASPDLHPYGGGTGTFVSDSGGTVENGQCGTTTTTTSTSTTSTSTSSTTSTTSTTSTSTSSTSTSTSTSTSSTSTSTTSTSTSSTSTSTTSTTSTTTSTSAEPSSEYLCVSGSSSSPSADGTYGRQEGNHNGYDFWAYDAGGTTYYIYYDTSDSRWELGSIYSESSPQDYDDGGIYPYSGSWGSVTVSAGSC